MAAYSTYSDQQLTILLKEGDHVAYTEIFNRFKFILQAHAVNKLRDREEARDIIQEVFVYLWTKREVIQFTENLSGYLYGAVRNAILNRITRKHIEGKYFDAMKAFSLVNQVETDTLVRENQLKAFIEQEIAQLPSKMRLVFELSRKDNLSHAAIAEQLGISEQTVSKQITNAIKILKVKLGVFIYLWFIMQP
jgi:RNA polymerase sigma-70 factor (family 1)